MREEGGLWEYSREEERGRSMEERNKNMEIYSREEGRERNMGVWQQGKK